MSAGPIWVGVTGISAADEPSAGLAVAQSLRRDPVANIRVTALVTSAFADGIQSLSAADEVAVLPSPKRDPVRFTSALGAMVRGRRFVFLPGSPGDVIALVPHRAALDRAGVHHLLPSPRQIAALPFLGLSRVAGVRIPRGIRLDLNNLRPVARRTWRWPLVVRTTDGRLAPAASVAEITPVARALARPWGVPSAIHEPVIGTEISVAVLGNRAGRGAGLAAALPLLRSDNAALWSAVTTTDPRVLTVARRILARVRWIGPAELRLIRDQAGTLWFTGLTPGFPAWISLAAAAGQSLARQYARLALGAAPLLSQEYRDGLFMSRVAMDLITSITTLGRLATEGVFTNGTYRHRALRTTVDRPARVRLTR